MRISKASFKKWLESKDKDMVISYAGFDSCTCPIAKFIEEESETVSDVMVTEKHIESYIRNIRQWKVTRTPVWAKSFIPSVDKLYRDKDVTADDALWLLEEFCY